MKTQISDMEKEVLILRAAMTSIGSIVNYNILTLSHNDPESEIRFKSDIHQKYFNIILMDLLQSSMFMTNTKVRDGLQAVLKNPLLNNEKTHLLKAVNSFCEWLDEFVVFEHKEETRNLWFPSIDKEIALQITRSEFIKICGNISKHNPLGLDRQAKVIQGIFKRNHITIDLSQSLLIMEEFYEQFHDDLFVYHSSTIVEFLNNISWAIFEYLQPLYRKSTKLVWSDTQKANHVEYAIPDDVHDPFVRESFWNILNDLNSKPYLPRFTVTKFLKMRY